MVLSPGEVTASESGEIAGDLKFSQWWYIMEGLCLGAMGAELFCCTGALRQAEPGKGSRGNPVLLRAFQVQAPKQPSRMAQDTTQ